MLSLAKLHLNTVPSTDEAAMAKVNDAKELVSKAINDLRDLSRSLHGEKLFEVGLQGTISNELKTLQNLGQFKTSMQVNGHDYKLDSQKSTVLFRMVQEALHNALKHSKASSVWVDLNYEPTLFKLAVCDDGVGFNQQLQNPTETGIGLKNIKNRAALLGGNISVISSPGNGTKIYIEIPQ